MLGFPQSKTYMDLPGHMFLCMSHCCKQYAVQAFRALRILMEFPRLRPIVEELNKKGFR
jgi:hypothetical protein